MTDFKYSEEWKNYKTPKERLPVLNFQIIQEPMDIRTNIEQMLSKVEHGKEKFNTSALFRASVETLARGQDPIIILDQIITIHEKLIQDHIELVKRHPNLVHVIQNTKSVEDYEFNLKQSWRNEESNQSNDDHSGTIKHFQD